MQEESVDITDIYLSRYKAQSLKPLDSLRTVLEIRVNFVKFVYHMRMNVAIDIMLLQ